MESIVVSYYRLRFCPPNISLLVSGMCSERVWLFSSMCNKCMPLFVSVSLTAYHSAFISVSLTAHHSAFIMAIAMIFEWESSLWRLLCKCFPRLHCNVHVNTLQRDTCVHSETFPALLDFSLKDNSNVKLTNVAWKTLAALHSASPERCLVVSETH